MFKEILAIDPGTTESGFVLVSQANKEIKNVINKGKLPNDSMLLMTRQIGPQCEIAIEMVASYGMPVGKEVFETCVWVGRFLEAARIPPCEQDKHIVYRQEEKLTLCHSSQAKDTNIIQALVDRYAYGQPNHGKGTKKNPGFFFGFAKDAWQAMAVAVTWLDRIKKEEED